MSDVCPGREKDYPRFPTPPPPFSGFDGKVVSSTRLPLPPGCQAHRQAGSVSHPNATIIAASIAMSTWAKPRFPRPHSPRAKPASSESHLGK